MKGLYSFVSFFAVFLLHAQAPEIVPEADSLYLEDQFYVGVTYNLLLNKPTGVTQRNLSYGLLGGFLKDIPLNSRRNIALGVGMGYAVNSYYNNLLATESGEGIVYTVLDEEADYKRSKVENHLIEVPLEFRWRNSTPSEYKFWRIYTGLKLGYVFASRSKVVSEERKVSFTNNDIRNFQYGLTLNVGYNTFNIHVYYALVNLFNKDVTILDGGDVIQAKPLRIGIIFYIL
jgi:hypothetical protein